MGAELPTTIVGLLGLTVIIVGGLLRLRFEQKAANRQLSKTSRKVDEMHEQVRNDHPQQPNLRHDLDLTRDAAADIHAIVRDMQDRQIAQDAKLDAKLDVLRIDLRSDISGLRTDMTEVSRELHDERKRSIDTDASLWRAINKWLPKAGG